MKNSATTLSSNSLTRLILIGCIIIAQAQVSLSVFAQNPSDKVIAQLTRTVLDASSARLNFPKTVDRYYKAKNDRLAWVEKGQINENTQTAMMLLDCVRQFG